MQYVAWWVSTRAQYVRGWVHTSRHRCARVYSTWVGTLRDGAGVYVYSAYVGGWVGRYVTFLRSASTTRHSSAMPGRCRPPNPGQPRHTGAVYNTRELTCERAHAPNACPPTHARTHARRRPATPNSSRRFPFMARRPPPSTSPSGSPRASVSSSSSSSSTSTSISSSSSSSSGSSGSSNLLRDNNSPWIALGVIEGVYTKF